MDTVDIKMILTPNGLLQNGVRLHHAIENGVNSDFLKYSLFVDVSMNAVGSWVNETPSV